MVDDSTAHTQTDSSQVSDPYVIYQLRKPSQRGTAVIPRFVPNTHAPAFSPANYRFSRVWTTNDNTAVSPSSLLHVPRSFEYAGSLGSESSFWSDTASWVSISSLRTTPSEARATLLHSNQNPMSAASFFNNDTENARLRNSFRASSARSSEIDSPVRNDFHYPAALSESVSEDAVIDDLLSLHKPQFPHLRDHPSSHTSSRDHAVTHRRSSYRNNHPSSHHRSVPTHSNPTRNSFLPSLTHKRRSLWQWLFCTNKAAMSTTVPSVTGAQTAAADRERVRPAKSSLHTPTASSATDNGRRKKTSNRPQSKDRIPKADKEFLNRTQTAPDAPAAKSRATRRRNPSFEIRRGRPSGATKSGRSMSWNFVPRGLLGRDREPQRESREKKKRKSKGKDKSRQVPAEDPEEPRKLHRIVFQRSSARKGVNPNKVSSRDRKKPTSRQTQRPANAKSRKELPKSPASSKDRLHQDRLREDRPREDRPRENAKPPLETKGVSAPLPKSIVPSLREKQTNKTSSQNQRMRSTGSSDPVTSRISSDLSTTTYGRTNESGSSRSTPIRPRQTYRSPMHDLDPAANGVSSDVSSHASGAVGKTSPEVNLAGLSQNYSTPSSPDIRGIDPSIVDLDSPHHASLFAFPSTSSGSGGFTEAQSKTPPWDTTYGEYPVYTSSFKTSGSTAPELIATMDPVARAKEKNRARSAGGPLSYLMKQHDREVDVDTQSTGLTSLADESVSTHKTVSVAGDEYQYGSQLPGGLHRNLYGETYRPPQVQDAHEKRSSGTAGTSRPIFQNYAMHPSRAKSPSHTSSAASPRRFHSDWSDPHATDIDVFCQCNCSCVYEEECRRSCELVYGRSPSVSSTRSRRGHQGFKTLPPTIQANSRQTKGVSTDLYDNTEREPLAFQNGIGSNDGHSQPSQKTYLRANAVDELPDPESEQPYSEMYKPLHAGQTGVRDVKGVLPGTDMSRDKAGLQKQARGKSRPGYGKERPPNSANQERRSMQQQNGLSHTNRGSDHKRSATLRGRTQRDQSGRRTDGRHQQRPDSHGNDETSKYVKQRPSSRRSEWNESSRMVSRQIGAEQNSGDESRADKLSKPGSDQKAKEGEPRLAQDWNAYGNEGGQQMGNSYVVKRSGLPPSSPAYTPHGYRGREYEGDAGEYRRYSGGDMNGTAPVVEVEYEKRRGVQRSGYQKTGPRRQRRNSREGQTQSKSLQTSKHTSRGSGRSRTPAVEVS